MADENDPVHRITLAGEHAYRNEMIHAQEEIQRLRAELKLQDDVLDTILKAATNDIRRSNELENYHALDKQNALRIAKHEATILKLNKTIDALNTEITKLRDELHDYVFEYSDTIKRQRAIIDRLRPVIAAVRSELSGTWETDDQIKWKIDQSIVWINDVLRETAE